MANERITIEKLQEYHGLIAQDANILKRSTVYILNQVVNKGKIYLQCTQAGTTASTALDLSSVDLDDELTDGTAKWKVVSVTGAGFGNSTGVGLEDWESNHDYAVDDIYVYEGEIYKTLIAFTSGATEDSRTKVNNIIPSVWAANTAYTAGNIIEHTDVTTLKKVYYDVTDDFTSGATFEVTAEMDELQITEEYVPNPLTHTQVQNLINNFVPSGSGTDPIFYNDSPIGTIIAYMGITAPKDYLACDGQTYNIVDYKELAEYIKVQFGSYNYFGGNGTTTFAVPDLRGEFLRGTGTNSHTNNILGVAEGSGANVGVHQGATSVYRLDAEGNTTWVHNVPTYKGPGNFDAQYISNRTGQITVSHSDQTGSIMLYTVRPTNTSVLYCIKYNTSVLSTPENNYSTEEQRIGTWIDGKPLYQITIVDTMPTVATQGTPADKSVDISSFMMSKVVDIKGVVYISSVFRSNSINSVSSFWLDGSVKAMSRFVNVDNNIAPNTYVTRLLLRTMVVEESEQPCYITLQYTKTTD